MIEYDDMKFLGVKVDFKDLFFVVMMLNFFVFGL